MRLSTLLIVTLALFFSPAVQAEEKKSNFPEIQKLMKQLNKDMGQAQAALFTEDHEKLALLAVAIGEHPKAPLSERLKVMATLLTDMPSFKEWDEKTHNAAKDLKAAAIAKDRKAETKAFVVITESCMGCHINFRDRLKE